MAVGVFDNKNTFVLSRLTSGADPPTDSYTLHAVGPGAETLLKGTLNDVFSS